MQKDEFDREIKLGVYARIGGAIVQYGSVIGAALMYKENPLFIIGGAAGYILGELGRIAGDGLTTNALIKRRIKESKLEKD